MPRYNQGGAFQFRKAGSQRLPSSLLCGEGNFLLPEPVRGTNLATRSPESGGCRLMCPAREGDVRWEVSMPQKPLSASKVRRLLDLSFSNNVNKSEVAKRLRISRGTVSRYITAFKCTGSQMSDIAHLRSTALFKLLFPNSEPRCQSSRKIKLLDEFASIHSRIENDHLSLLVAWREHIASRESAYQYSQFASLYAIWRHEHGYGRRSRSKTIAVSIKSSDIPILKKWRMSHDRRKWEVGIALEDLSVGISPSAVARRVGRSQRTIENWALLYEREGMGSLPSGSTRTLAQDSIRAIEIKKERLIKIIHENPRAYDINRASWSLQSLADAYCETHDECISKSSISEYFIELGYKFKKAKRVLTSNDSTYRDKLTKITDTLSNLAQHEKFFSIDEFGPFSVKIRGGTALVAGDVVRTIPQRQMSKGSLICTAALELSTNQVTHFYSKTKNTREMVKLLKRLIEVYKHERRLFISWDSASWHASKSLYATVDEFNGDEFRIAHKTPFVELIPLPSGAQFLNVIESVFSGMSRAILHNSDYGSVDECMEAIDRYFEERNRAFLEHPRRAGKKIWGKERMEPVFKEANICKDPNWR
jgi:transposase